MKLEKSIYNRGDLLYWNDFWNATCGIGLFIGYVNDFNVRDISVSEEYYVDKSWVNLLITEGEFLQTKVFPQTSVCLQYKFKSLEEFNNHVKHFRKLKH